MVKNITKKPEFYCIYEHEAPILMKERERSDDNKDNFLACPKYMRRDENHPDGFDEHDKHGCLNRLSLSSAGDIIVAFNEMVQKDMDNGIIADYEGCKFSLKNQRIDITVLKHSPDELKFGIINQKAINQ